MTNIILFTPTSLHFSLSNTLRQISDYMTYKFQLKPCKKKNPDLYFFHTLYQHSLLTLSPATEIDNLSKTDLYQNIFLRLEQKELLGEIWPIKACLSHLYLQIEYFKYIFKYIYNLDIYSAEYFKIFIMFSLIFSVSILLFAIAYFLSLNFIKNAEKLSQYECGFEPFDEATRHPFDIHFYVVGILFLIFDVEIALLFPWVYGLKMANWLGFYIMIIFLVILTIGFFYEWHRGALIWPHQKNLHFGLKSL